MTFGSRDAFPARGGVGDERRFDSHPVPGTSVPGTDSSPARYVELHAHSAYSFLDGASLPEELAARAAELGYDALALTDHDGVYGSLEFAHAAKHFGVRPITGAEVTLEGGMHVTLLCETQRGYANLCRILTDAHAGTRPEEGARAGCRRRRRSTSIAEHAEGLVCLSGCARHGLGVARRERRRSARARRFAARSTSSCSGRSSAATRAATHALASSPSTLGVPTVATGDVHAHHERRAELQDALVAIRHRTSLDGCERERRGNHESRAARAGRRCSSGCRATRRCGRARSPTGCAFDLTQELGYRYPDFSDGADPADVQLREICDRAFPTATGARTATGAARASGSTTSCC